MRDKKILIVAAHPDDIEFGMGGTVSKLSKDNSIYSLILCKGDRPGAEEVEYHRQCATLENAEELGIIKTDICDYSDVKLDTVKFLDIVHVISGKIDEIGPDIIYTHYECDVHRDHRIVSEAVRIATRPRKALTVNELYQFFVPGSTEWGQSNGAQANVAENITEEYNTKMLCISRYNTEVRDCPDPTSFEKIFARDTYYGGLYGYDKAEVFKLIFKRS